MEFQALVRYEHEGSIFYGNLVQSSEFCYIVERLHGNIEAGLETTNIRDTAAKVSV